MRLRPEPELLRSQHGRHRGGVREGHREGRGVLPRHRRDPVHASGRAPLPALLPLPPLLGPPPPPDPSPLRRLRR
ncbi:hypothetical protein MUK42_05167 [Musa troglodytarum]|uniref:Uncharacterized protein n=1 Tax=Musa troglodytarum TaxID=320322 RepID=A0A9E7I023_9LILI|nr:hypothetical protein MUK42_05167 [Musa troglodytarum]